MEQTYFDQIRDELILALASQFSDYIEFLVTGLTEAGLNAKQKLDVIESSFEFAILHTEAFSEEGGHRDGTPNEPTNGHTNGHQE